MKSKKSLRVRMLLCSGLFHEAEEVVQFLTDNRVMVDPITPDKKFNPEDAVLILPDTGGINLTAAPMIAPEYDLPPNFPPQNQWMEYFRVNRLDEIVYKRGKILGIGTSALVLWGHKGGKLSFTEDGSPIPSGTVPNCDLNGLLQGSFYEFRIGKHLWGKEKLTLDDDFLAALEKFSQGQELTAPAQAEADGDIAVEAE